MISICCLILSMFYSLISYNSTAAAHRKISSVFSHQYWENMRHKHLDLFGTVSYRSRLCIFLNLCLIRTEIWYNPIIIDPDTTTFFLAQSSLARRSLCEHTQKMLWSFKSPMPPRAIKEKGYAPNLEMLYWSTPYWVLVFHVSCLRQHALYFKKSQHSLLASSSGNETISASSWLSSSR